MPLIWSIERILLELIRFNNCIILIPLQVVLRSRIGIHISNSMSLHFLVECSVSNSCCALLTLRFNLLLQWLGIFSPSLSCLCNRWFSLICFDELPCSESPPSIPPLQYPRPYECTMDNWDVTGFFVGDMIRQGRDVSVTGEKKRKKSRGRVTSLSGHACLIVTVSRVLLIYNPASKTIYLVWPV